MDSSSGQALESAQVYLPALSLGALSNSQGRFVILNVPVGTHEIKVELIGYSPATQTVTVRIGETTDVDFGLNATALRLQELVVTGVAGETPRVKLPFTVEKLDLADLPVPASSAEGLLTGKVPGVRVVKPSGQPGTAAGILLRGPTTITGTQDPLIIVDGVITDNTLADIGSLDVESIEIVKGAAASSLYGSRAQNGVVQIRTKRGTGLEVDQSRIITRSEYGWQSLEKTVPASQAHWFKTDAQGNILDVEENIVRDILTHTEETGNNIAETAFKDKSYPSYIPFFNPQEQLFDPGRYLSQYAAVEGRTGSTNYRASFTYQDEQGVVPGYLDGAQLKGFRLNLDHQVREELSVGLSTYYAQAEQDLPYQGAHAATFYALAFLPPYADLTRRDPETIGLPHCPKKGCLVAKAAPFSNVANPLYALELDDTWNERGRFLGSANLVWSPATWFELEGNFALDRSDFSESRIVLKGLELPDGGIGPGEIRKAQSISNDMNASFTAAFNRAFGDLTTRTRLRYLMEDQHYESFNVTGRETQAFGVQVLDNTATFDGGSSISDVVSEGYFFISALDYRGKYVGDVLVRRDGSSLFGPEERWQTYYRASGAWRWAQEDWWPFEAIDEFKLRYSIGTAGGRPRFAAQYETYTVSSSGIFPETLGNKRLKPELTTEQEAGVEVVLFGKVNAGALYAWSTTEDQLLQQPLSGPAGFSSQWVNAGTIESNTYEAWVELALIDNPEMTWTSRVNFDRTRQKITRLDIPSYRTGFLFVREGEVLGTFHGNLWASACGQLPAGTDCSQFQVNDDGLLVWVGPGNDYTEGFSKNLWFTGAELSDEQGGVTHYSWGYPIKATGLDDRGRDTEFLYLGNTTPDFNLSWGNTFRWKNLSLFALFDGEFGADVYNQTRQYPYRDDASRDQDQIHKPEELKKPILYYQVLYNIDDINSWFVDDGTFVKLREASLRYAFDRDRVRRWFGRALGLDGLSIDVIGRNLFTWTDYPGYDPEMGIGDVDTGGGSPAIGRVDNFGYPNFRTVSLSLQVIF